jgi:predicted Zn-dependent protease with MMP-like domain
MTPKEFDAIVAEAFALVPEKFRSKVKNVALLVEAEPNDEVRRENNLGPGDTLLGLYRGIPQTARGDGYGVGVTLPDTITIFRDPILEEARYEAGIDPQWGKSEEFTTPMKKRVRIIVRNTIWHEIAHYFGMDESEVDEREQEGTNEFPQTPKTTGS